MSATIFCPVEKSDTGLPKSGLGAVGRLATFRFLGWFAWQHATNKPIKFIVLDCEIGSTMSGYQIVLKEVPATKVISLRRVLVKPQYQRLLWAELLEYCEKNNVRIAGTALAIYRSVGAGQGDWDIEVCIPVDADHTHTPTGDVKISILPAVEVMACTIHTGSFHTIKKAYTALNEWVEKNGYHITGPTRELNLRLPSIPSNQSDSDAVNEIQFPIDK